MAYPAYIREKAQRLRREKKMTIDEIAECLALPRTTIYYWVRDMPIPRTPRQIEGSARGRRLGNRRMQNNYRQLRDAAYEEGVLTFLPLLHHHGFRDFVCMYIGEGYKRCRNTVSLNNSDPAIVKLADRWIRRLSKNIVSYSLQYHADQDPGELKQFWATELGIDAALISVQRKSNSNGLTGRKWRSQYGLLTVRTGDTQLRAELQAWMDCVQDEWLDSAEVGA
jgi:hypothetical protein